MMFNGVAILNNDRFLEKCRLSPAALGSWSAPYNGDLAIVTEILENVLN